MRAIADPLLVNDAKPERELTTKALAEALGTFFLALNIGMCSGDLAPFAVGGTLMIMVYAFGHISGGHFNPAVTLAVYLRGKLGDATNAAYYALAQFAGAFAGAFVSNILSDEPGYPAPAADAGALKALLAEAIYTFALCSVVLNVTTTKNQEGNSFFGLAIGATLTCSALAAAGISGGAFNPAVGTGLPLAAAADFSSVWIYWAGPLLGGAAAGAAFKLMGSE
ncbi:hypothetical protein EMIHUDRAFT_197567 [Emiliania huxleyi CCMP1516]|uniref:Aquaporin n=2 Tax=Emiliania huxleyi TaxID=2903 RepID=A0A0D3IUI1_EMIH1|nr:hypothetical protein EMIHUDRAFT_197567 [Emiliania huxleyi CCMP1516]EOD14916.1 hypothetical protein EMIHUDRAFT_197567 [Emiliania huxleyi CCMP1516]|eukprot:XP_005767345.1 hypothetical protein EMIHUDRAFT_197567 [Emiliania huxleyi CCMP1516]